MPGATQEQAPVHIVDPTSATDEEIDPSVDRDRIRVVCSTISLHRLQRANLSSWLALQKLLHPSNLTERTTRWVTHSDISL